MTESCFVCCENFNLADKAKISCNNPSCEFLACKTCHRNYLLNNVNDIHCMNCKQAWDQTFIILNLNRNWVNNVYKNHRSNLLFQSEQSKFPETMPHVEKYNQIITIQKEKERNLVQIEALQRCIRELYHKNREHDRNIRVIETGKADVERQKFIMSCQKEDCKGFLSTGYKCGVCNDFCCSKCLKVLGPDKNIDHECKKEDIDTAEYIKNTTKPCPNCGERINKIDGCDQMWCTTCHTAFSWKTGQIQNGTVHNPHYFQYMRNANNGIIPRQPGDNPCNDAGPMLAYIMRCIDNKLYDNTYIIFTKKNKNDDNRWDAVKQITVKENKKSDEQPKIDEHIQLHHDTSYIASAFSVFRHIEIVEAVSCQHAIEECNNTVSNRVKYILNETTKQEFLDNLTSKDAKRRKNTDLLYIYDLIRTVGKDTINSVFSLIDNQMQLSRAEVHQAIMEKSVEEIKNHFSKLASELTKFIEYCNKQFDIIGVSHNCTSKHLLITNTKTYVNFRHVKTSDEIDKNLLAGYMKLNSIQLKSKAKSTIKKIKESYSKI